MAGPNRYVQVGSIIWSVLIAIGVLALGASIMLPSTKRARVEFVHPADDQQQQGASQPNAAPATQP